MTSVGGSYTAAVSYAPTGRATCKDVECKQLISQDDMRITLFFPSPMNDAELWNRHYHADCLLLRSMPQARSWTIKNATTLEGYDVLLEEDAARLRDLVEQGVEIREGREPPVHVDAANRPKSGFHLKRTAEAARMPAAGRARKRARRSSSGTGSGSASSSAAAAAAFSSSLDPEAAEDPTELAGSGSGSGSGSSAGGAGGRASASNAAAAAAPAPRKRAPRARKAKAADAPSTSSSSSQGGGLSLAAVVFAHADAASAAADPQSSSAAAAAATSDGGDGDGDGGAMETRAQWRRRELQAKRAKAVAAGEMTECVLM